MVSKRGDETEVLKYLTLLMILFAAAWMDLCTEKISNRLIFFRNWNRTFFPVKGTRSSGNPILFHLYFYSGYRILSVISDACAWRRRYQIIFRNWCFFEYEWIVQMRISCIPFRRGHFSFPYGKRKKSAAENEESHGLRKAHGPHRTGYILSEQSECG